MITNKNCILRLSRYKSALARLKYLGFVKVFSDNLADAVGVTAAQVRKDFSIFAISGNKKGGYQVDALIARLNEILGKDRTQNVIVVGAGHIGAALMQYRGFEQEGMKIVAGFDIDPARFAPDSLIPVYSLEELKNFVSKNDIRIGIIAVPDIAAQRVLDIMVSAGIKGVLNFAPIQLRVQGDCVINNINVGLELENLIYYVNAARKAKKRIDNEDEDI